MYYAVVTSTAAAVGIGSYCACVRNDTFTFRDIYRIEDAVRYVRSLKLETDGEMKTYITNSIFQDGIPEKAMVRMSNLHKEWGDDLGIRGYAINCIWSSIVAAHADERWVLIEHS